MAINYPGSLDDGTTLPSVTDDVTLAEAEQYNDVKDVTIALETKVGIDNSVVKTTHEYKINSISSIIHKLMIINNVTNPNYQLDINADLIALEDTNHNQFFVRDIDLTISITTSGVNGLDTGAEASNTWYSVWVIYDGTTVSGLFSISATAPTMPSGYTYKRRVGWIRNNASSNFLSVRQIDNRCYHYNWLKILTGGTAIVWTDVDCSAVFPATSRELNIVVWAPGQAGVSYTAYLRSNDSPTGEPYFLYMNSPHANVYYQKYVLMPCDSSQIIEYYVYDSTLQFHILAVGYIDQI